MMHKARNVFVAVLVLGACSVGAMAQKIGYVATDLIRSKYEANEQAEQRLESQVNEWKAELAQAQRDIDDLELDLKKNRLIWSDSERQSRDKQIEEKRRERDKLARQRFEPGGEYDRLSEQLFKGVWSKIYLSVQKVAAAEGYDMVWDKSTQPLVYVNAKFDITVKVMQELGIEADDLDKKQKDAIANDPRNKKLEEPRRRRSRSALPNAKETPEKPKDDVKTFDGDMWTNPDGSRTPKQDVGPTPIDTTFRPTPRDAEVPR